MNKPGSNSPARFAALIGLDWADGKHDICLQVAGRSKREASVLEHRPETIDEWARGLRKRFGGQPVALALELTKGPIVYALRKYEFIVLFPLNPASLAKYRDVFTPSGAKDDPSDAEIALEFLLKHPERLKPLNPQSAPMRALLQLVEMRRRLVDALLVKALVEQLRATLHAIEAFDQEIASRAPAHPDFSIFDSFPAAGPAFAPRLLTAFGEQRERFPSPDDLQRYAGVAPVTERSGNTTWVHWRWKCPTFLRQTFVEWAALTIPRSFRAAAYYQHQRRKGIHHQAAVRALAYKWIRILHHCWRTGQKYDESVYLKALKRRGSPLLEHIAAEATQNA